MMQLKQKDMTKTICLNNCLTLAESDRNEQLKTS